MGIKPPTIASEGLPSELGTAYDIVKEVYDNLPALTTLAEDFDNLEQNFVPKTRTVNGKDLSNNIIINYSDLGNIPATLTDYSSSIASATTGIFKKTAAGVWAFSSLTATDIPVLDTGKLTSGTLPVVRGGTGRTDNKSAGLINAVNITIGSTSKSFDGSAAVAWTLAELGAQAVNANLTSFSALTGAADRLPYFTGLNTVTLATFTAFGRSVVAAADATAVNNLLGVQTKVDADLVTELFNSATYDANFVTGIYKEYRGKYLYQLPLLEVLTCTRNSTATALGPTAVNTFDINEPRIAYDQNTGKRLGLLGEEARTNLLLYSEDISNAAWTKINTGTVTAKSVTTVAGQILNVRQGVTKGASAVGYTGTWELSGTLTAVSLSLDEGVGTNRVILDINLVTGVTTIPNVTGTFVLVSLVVTKSINGWVIALSVTSDTSTSIRQRLSCTGDGSVINIYRQQLETGPSGSSYIPTTNIALNRLGDVINEPLSITNASAGSIFVEFTLTSLNKISGSRATIIKINDSINTGQRGFGLIVENNTFFAHIRNAVTSNSVPITVADSLSSVKALVSFDNTTLKFLVAINGIVNEVGLGSSIDLTGFVSHLYIAGASSMAGTFISHSKTVKRCSYFARSFTAAEAATITK